MLRICCQDHLNESLSKLLFMTCSSFSIQPPFVLSPIDRSCIPRVAWEQPTFRNVTIGFPAKWRLRNERRNSTVTTCYCLDRNASDWFKQISLVARPVRITAAIRVVTRDVINRELKNHDEVHDHDVCWLGKDWNENVSFGGKKET